VLALQEVGIRHRYIRPRRPQQNGKALGDSAPWLGSGSQSDRGGRSFRKPGGGVRQPRMAGLARARLGHRGSSTSALAGSTATRLPTRMR
jgi:hypothetical protein